MIEAQEVMGGEVGHEVTEVALSELETCRRVFFLPEQRYNLLCVHFKTITDMLKIAVP